MDSFFKSIVPTEELNKWIPEEKPWVGECGGGAAHSWIPLGQHTDDWDEHLVIVFCCKPYRVLKRQYLDIQEAVEMRRKNLGISCSKWNFIPISNMDGIVEYVIADGKGKCILRTILSDNCMFVFSFEFKSSLVEKIKQKKELCLVNIKDIKKKKLRSNKCRFMDVKLLPPRLYYI